MKKISILVISVLSMAMFSSVFAIGGSLPDGRQGIIPSEIKKSREGIKQERQKIRENIKQERQELRGGIKESREKARGEIKEARTNARQEIKEIGEKARLEFQQKREEAKRAMEQKREEFKNAMESKKTEAKAAFEKKHEELKAKLAKIKDEKKKTAVEKINNEIARINENRTNHFSENLNKLEKVLTNIGLRADKAAANGVDVSTVKTAIDSANAAIAESRTAISAQAGKIYSIVVNTEATLRQDVGKTHQELKADLDKVRATVEKAKQAVRNAAVTLAQIPKVDELEVNSTPAPAATETVPSTGMVPSQTESQTAPATTQ